MTLSEFTTKMIANSQSELLISILSSEKIRGKLDEVKNEEITLISSRYRRVCNKEKQGLISEEDANIEKNKIEKSLIALATSININYDFSSEIKNYLTIKNDFIVTDSSNNSKNLNTKSVTGVNSKYNEIEFQTQKGKHKNWWTNLFQAKEHAKVEFHFKRDAENGGFKMALKDVMSSFFAIILILIICFLLIEC